MSKAGHCDFSANPDQWLAGDQREQPRAFPEGLELAGEQGVPVAIPIGPETERWVWFERAVLVNLDVGAAVVVLRVDQAHPEGRHERQYPQFQGGRVGGRRCQYAQQVDRGRQPVLVELRSIGLPAACTASVRAGLSTSIRITRIRAPARSRRSSTGRRSRTVRVSVTPTSLISVADRTSLSRAGCRGERNFSAGTLPASLATSRSTAVRTSSTW